MSAHTCRTFDPGCYRCDLSRDEADAAIITDPDVMVSDRRRTTCGRCGKRRLCTDYVQWGIPGIGITRCDPCEASVTGRPPHECHPQCRGDECPPRPGRPNGCFHGDECSGTGPDCAPASGRSES